MAEAADLQGTTGPGPARRRLRRMAAVLAGAPLLAALLTMPPAHAAPAAPQQPARLAAANAAAKAPERGSVDVAIDTLSPNTPMEGDTLTVSGTVTNRGKETVGPATVDVRLGSRMSSRGQIDAVAKRGAFRSGADGEALGGSYRVRIPALPSGVSQDFSLRVPVDELGLDGEGVYQLGVTLSGRTPSEPYDQVLGIERTFLPWQPEATEKKTQLTYLWPLVSSAHLSAETGTDDQQTPVFEDDKLAAELAPGGRLERLVSLGAELPVTWVIDPDLLATVEAMTNSYQVKNGDQQVAGKNQAVAERWLDSLEKAVQGRKVVALPYGDPDLASLAHRGKEVSGSLSHLRPATDVAETAVETILHVKPSVDFAWPVDGAVDPSIVDVATSAGADKIIARGDSLRDDLSYAPNAARPIGGGTTAVVSDASLSTAFQGDMTRADSSTLAVQQFLAQTLALTHQQPGKERNIVVAPQRMPSAAQAQSMATALRALSAQRWSQPSDLVAAAAAKPDPGAATQVPGERRYPGRLRAAELPVATYRDVRTTQETLDDFAGILTQPDRVVTPFGNAIDRGMSTSWRGQAEAANGYRTGVLRHLKNLTAEVQLIDKSDLTLSGRSATIPVTVQNQLVQGIDRLTLRLTSTKPTRLKLNGDSSVAELPVRIDGGHSQSVKFTASAAANGRVPVTAQLFTPDGKRYGRPMTFTVEVSEITPTVMLVIAGGFLLLVLAGVRMYTQRKRAAADGGGEADDAPTDGGPGPEGGDGGPVGAGSDSAEDDRPGAASGPGQPSDPAPDTAAQSTAAPGQGEKVDR
ncbi:DUF6049 family protein [Streptomyces solincola]|uniref:DUF6049 family protein n=1 Tax=Streptomyces solincola TaxID=2100817 RepID=UPI0015E3C546|nr:DUF6049 family protein [Streptomyces solincola]